MARRILAAAIALACAGQPSGQRSAEDPRASDAGVTGAQVRIEGCAARPDLADQPPTRAAPPSERLEVQGSRDGVRVVHQVPHACCLRAAVVTEVTGTAVFVRERLSGSPCRCMCASTLTTTLPLSPGTYEIAVELDVNGRKQAAPRHQITIQ